MEYIHPRFLGPFIVFTKVDDVSRVVFTLIGSVSALTLVYIESQSLEFAWWVFAIYIVLSWFATFISRSIDPSGRKHILLAYVEDAFSAIVWGFIFIMTLRYVMEFLDILIDSLTETSSRPQ